VSGGGRDFRPRRLLALEAGDGPFLNVALMPFDKRGCPFIAKRSGPHLIRVLGTNSVVRILPKYVDVIGDELVCTFQVVKPDFLAWSNRIKLDFVLYLRCILIVSDRDFQGGTIAYVFQGPDEFGTPIENDYW
jgi:hypothetical protein